MQPVAAEAIDRRYRPMKNPAFLGQVRSMTWGVPVHDPKAHMSPLWAERARDYWQRQERIFGLVMSDFTLAADDFPETGPVISTFAIVMEILPGERDPSMMVTQ